MRINTKMRYGTRALVELARHYDESEPLSLSRIAAAQEISEKYLEALLGSLRAAGLVTATRGPQGGYALARPPREITLRDVYGVLEGAAPYAPCAAGPSACHRSATCVTQGVWARMYRASMEILESTTLADLASDADCDGEMPAMYEI